MSDKPKKKPTRKRKAPKVIKVQWLDGVRIEWLDDGRLAFHLPMELRAKLDALAQHTGKSPRETLFHLIEGAAAEYERMMSTDYPIPEDPKESDK